MCGRKLKGGRNLGPSILLESGKCLQFFLSCGSISLLAAISSDHILARSPLPRTELPHDRTVVFINLTVESQLER